MTGGRKPRRSALAVVGLLVALTGCATTESAGTPPAVATNADYAPMYAAVQDGDTTIPAVDVGAVDRQFLRQVVDYETVHPVGTVVVDPYARFLYLVMEDGKAMRYGVGVAKAGLEFEGEADVARKAAWPRWTPTPDMIAREPERYGPYAAGLDGSLDNPLGARALYLFQDGRDTLYRIHGTTEPWSIGKSVSSGCIRLFNQDILDLYARVPDGARVVVLGPQQSARGEA
jgi:lipoprotein-anchoring transpeptidase ErfK/SrfK